MDKRILIGVAAAVAVAVVVVVMMMPKGEAPPTVCGDRICAADEDMNNCPGDCNPNFVPEPSPPGPTPGPEPAGGYSLELHEWGVMAGCPHGGEYFATARPEIMMMVKQPVVYVHSEGVDEMDLSVRFENGRPTDMYPEGTMASNVLVPAGNVIWNDVVIGGSCEKTVGAKAGMMRIPLEDLIPTLSNVDSDCLDVNGQKERFLFYEGNLSFENRVEVTYDVDQQTATLKNNGDKTVYNVMLAHQVGNFIDAETYTAMAGDLAAGEEKTVDFKVQDTGGLVKSDMVSLGFTNMEADAFVNIWDGPFFFPTNAGFTNLIYRLDQSEYDEMLPASVSPQPTKFVRTMYVLVDIVG